MRRAAAALLAAACAAPAAAQEAATHPYWVAAAYEHARFDGGAGPGHLASVEAGARGGAGAVLLRASAAERFGARGRLLEAEAYPRLGDAVYAQLSAGVADGALFPRFHAGAEVYASPAPGVELSAGARRLAFAPEGVTLLTGSAGLYLGETYLVARPYAALEEGEVTYAGMLHARRYLGDADRWVGVRASHGAAPAERVTRAELGRVSATRVAVEGRVPLTPRLVAGADAGWERERLPAGAERSRLALGVRLEHRFR